MHLAVRGPSIKEVRTKSTPPPLFRKIFALAQSPSPYFVHEDIPQISKNPKFFAPKRADVRMWRTSPVHKYPHWTIPSPLTADVFYGRLLMHKMAKKRYLMEGTLHVLVVAITTIFMLRHRTFETVPDMMMLIKTLNVLTKRLLSMNQH